ncbi:Bgt-20371 [Blumeria graminis f. sp. tritici]|uniref:Uncharacterized protein n=2 Tax=Blumeria graminis f. sp. tritici TaxID=62690 RepID=A0A656KIU0_BLUGR|nr:hypothetical protein BGT96224_AE21186 [Blumeria graminis f. sp. tritici 96224]VDB91207.1 Bgt-20371 [Blumeria graminis f. sp. tritici]
MRFSSLAIVYQIASIFVTSKAWAIMDHIFEQSKIFNCGGVDVGYYEFAVQRRTVLSRSASGRNPRPWSLVVQELFKNKPMGEEDPPVMFRDDYSTSLTYYKLDEKTRLMNYGSHNLRTDYVVAIDPRRRACSMILKTQEEARDNSWLGEPSFEFCTIN